MSEETKPEVKKKVVAKKTTKVKAVEQAVKVQGNEVLLSEINDARRGDICLEIQKWKNGGGLDAHRRARIARYLGIPVKGLSTKRADVISFASELNELGIAFECKTVKGKSCCG
jgi:hypothetical protein